MYETRNNLVGNSIPLQTHPLVTHLITSFVAHNDEHRAVAELNAVLDHHADAIVDLLFDHVDQTFGRCGNGAQHADGLFDGGGS